MTRVAITGFGVVSPLGVGREPFFAALAAGRSGIGPITGFDASTFAVRLAGEVKGPLALPERVARVAAADRKVGFAYAAVAEAMADAGLRRFADRLWLHLGTSLEVFDLRKVIHDGRVDFAGVAANCLAPGAPPLQFPLDTAARLLAQDFGRPGRALTNCSACAAGAQAIGHGYAAVRAGRCDVAVCGGFDSMLNPLGVGGFQLLGALTTDNERGATACRPFDASRSGTVLGEGAAVFVLEPLAAARAAGKPVWAEVCGYGSSLDAGSLSAPDADGAGAARAMTAALADAGLAPARIQHINTHGTGTYHNDVAEALAIRRVFAGVWPEIPVAATKSQTGHLIAAAGALEAGACLLALARGVLPPNIGLTRVGKDCELHHITERGQPFAGEYVLNNSFGFGGQNAALILRRGDG